MNPNREHIDDEMSVNEGAVTEVKNWLVRPPRRAKRDRIGVPLLCAFAIGWFAFAASTTTSALVPGGGAVLGAVVLGVAEVVPAQAVRAAMGLRLIGMVLFVAGMAVTLLTPPLSAS